MSLTYLETQLILWQLSGLIVIALHLIGIIHLAINWDRYRPQSVLFLAVLLLAPLFGVLLYWARALTSRRNSV